MTETTLLALVWYGLLALSVALALTGAVWLVRVRLFLARARRATGTVLGTQATWHHADGAASPVHLPLLSYTDAEGQAREGVAHLSAGHDAFPPGSTWPIRYDPDNPDIVMLDWFWSEHIFPLTLLGTGLGLAVLFLAIRGAFFGG